MIMLVVTVSLAQRELSQLSTIGVDTEQHNIPLDEILSGGPPPNGIPPIGFTGDWKGAASATPAPAFVTQDQASEWLEDQEPVVAFSLGEETKAYPLQILTWHEIVNDEVGGVPVAVTFCPLCNSALAFDRRIPLTEATQTEVTDQNPEATTEPLDDTFLEAYEAQGGDAASLTGGLEVSLGVSGTLYNSNLLMFDSGTSTLWSQILGAGNVGILTDTELLRYPAQIVSYAEFKEAFPDAPVLSRETGVSRRYGQNPYVGYDDADSPAFLFSGVPDERLEPKARVISVDTPQETAAYPFSILEERRVVNDTVGAQPVTLFWQEGTSSALDTGSIAEGRDVGAVGVFAPDVEGRSLTFTWSGEAFTDEETGSTWNLLGQAVEGELAGAQLKPVVHDNTLWFAWAAFKPETRVYSE